MLGREAAVAESGTPPAVAGYHHFAPTVSDMEASAQWYERVFGMTRVPVAFPHHGAEQEGYAVVLAERADLDAWARWLDSLGVENSGVVDTGNPVPYSVVVFRDPDHIQLELIYMPR
jgi:glyoxylase I family protein